MLQMRGAPHAICCCPCPDWRRSAPAHFPTGQAARRRKPALNRIGPARRLIDPESTRSDRARCRTGPATSHPHRACYLTDPMIPLPSTTTMMTRRKPKRMRSSSRRCSWLRRLIRPTSRTLSPPIRPVSPATRHIRWPKPRCDRVTASESDCVSPSCCSPTIPAASPCPHRSIM